MTNLMKSVFPKVILIALFLLPLHTGQAQNDNIAVVDWNFDGTKLAIGYTGGTVEIRDMLTGETKQFEHQYAITLTSLSWSPTDNRLAVATNRGTVRIFDVETDQIVLELDAGDFVGDVIWWPDGTEIVTTTVEGTYPHEYNLVTEWNAVTGESYGNIGGMFPGQTGPIAIAPDNNHMAIAAATDGVAVWTRTESGPPTNLGERIGNVDALAWSPDGSRVAVGRWDNLQIWSWPNPELLVSFQSNKPISGLTWSTDSTRIALIDIRHVYVLEAATGQVLYTTETAEYIDAIAWNPIQDTIVYGGESAIAHIVAPSDLSTPTPTETHTPMLTPTLVPVSG